MKASNKSISFLSLLFFFLALAASLESRSTDSEDAGYKGPSERREAARRALASPQKRNVVTGRKLLVKNTLPMISSRSKMKDARENSDRPKVTQSQTENKDFTELEFQESNPHVHGARVRRFVQATKERQMESAAVEGEKEQETAYLELRWYKSHHPGKRALSDE